MRSRLVTSRIPFTSGRMIGNNIPMAFTRQVKCRFSVLEQRQYQFDALPLLRKIHKRRGKKVVWEFGVVRKLQLLCCWLGALHLGDYLKAENSTTYQSQLDGNATLGRKMARMLIVVQHMATTDLIKQMRDAGNHKAADALEAHLGPSHEWIGGGFMALVWNHLFRYDLSGLSLPRLIFWLLSRPSHKIRQMRCIRTDQVSPNA